jgi:transposase
MPATSRFPDSLRLQAINLSLEGMGYKAIASALGVSRDTVRGWIKSYRLTGRTASVQSTGRRRINDGREDQFQLAREEYENTLDSLRIIAERHGLNYYNLRYFLQQYHPESALLHSYTKRAAALQTVLAEQMASIQKKGEEILRQMREELDEQLRRLG